MKEFILKCFIMTCCIYFLFNNFFPRYEVVDASWRMDKITGKKEWLNSEHH